jgi:hypothetical protein
MGVGSILLTGPISRSVDLLPHGLSEKVLWPFIVHSQIWWVGSTLGAIGGVAGRICATLKVGAGGAGAGAGAGDANARAAIDSPPKIHGRRFLPLSMSSILVRALLVDILQATPKVHQELPVTLENSPLRLKRPLSLKWRKPCHGFQIPQILIVAHI